MSVEVSVVIPVRDGADTIRRQLDALVAQLTPDVEVVVVDNGSTDTTAAVVESVAALHPAVRLESEPDGGANAARNHGIASSSGSLILLCDGDDEVAVNWIAAMRSVLETHELAGSPIDPRTVDGRRGTIEPRSFELWGLGAPFGCGCGVRRSVWEDAGGFDPRLFGGYDELDFFLRAQLRGARLGWAHDTVVHYRLDDSEAKRTKRRRESDMNSRRVYWQGRRAGRPATPELWRDMWFLLTRLPFIVHSPARRSMWTRAAVRRWDRGKGFVRFGLAELIGRSRNDVPIR